MIDDVPPPADSRPDSDRTPIVGIGASAGGIEALSALFEALPPDTGLAFVIVQHLDRTHASFLTEILANATRMKVSAAEDGKPVERNHLYVITPNTTLAIAGGRMTVKPRGDDSRVHLPVDVLFGSLAESIGKRAIGVVLSGTGSDGTLGLQAIKSKGGITFAQDDATAKFYGMPGSAIASGAVDYVLPPRDIARELERIARHPYLVDSDFEAATATQPTEIEWNRLFRLLRHGCNADFTNYKRSTLRRRLMRRLALKHFDTVSEYVDLLERDPAELSALYQDMLIRVTSFFRDPETFEGLASVVFPRLIEGRARNDPIRIWVPGCSTGEEVYSIAIALESFLGDAADTTPVQIFGTDINASAIERARAGRYVPNVALDIAPEWLDRFFIKLDDHFEVAKRIRDLCVFAVQNVGRDPPFSKLDLVSCRNLLIYLDASMQKRVLRVFHYALNPDCFLLLGPSETIGQGSDLFELIDIKHKIYRRLGMAARAPLDLVAHERVAIGRARGAKADETEMFDLARAQKEADQLLISRYAPAALLIDEHLNVLQFRGRTSPYLEHQPGAASLQLAKHVHPGLLVELANVIDEAKKGAPARRENVRMQVDGDERRVDIEVIPLKSPTETMRCLLVLFAPHDGEVRAAGRDPMPRSWLGHLLSVRRSPDRSIAELQHERDELKSEIDSTRAYLNSMIEAHEAAQEELRSANEEVLSANEEFQSTNEELETAKEELQSANEELATTNEELSTRNVELNQLNEILRRSRDYAQAIVETVRIPLLLLTRELRIRSANRAYYEHFNTTREQTENCLFFELANGAWKDAQLRSALLDVISNHGQVAGREFHVKLPRLGERTLVLDARRLVRESEAQSDLLLLSIDDVTERDRALRTTRQQAELLDQSHDAILVWELNGPIRYWNRGAQELYGWTAADATGKAPDALLKTQRTIAYEALEQALLHEGRWAGEQSHTTRDGRRIIVDAVYTLTRPDRGAPLILETNRDVTDRKHAEEALREQDRRKDEFLAMLGHELRNPLAPITNALHLLHAAPDPAEITRLHEMIERQVTLLTRIVDDLLDVARVTQGRIELRREAIDLRELIARGVESTRTQYESRRQKLIADLPEGRLVAVVDPARIEQLVVNLLSNASRYSADGTTIRVALGADDAEALIRVRDEGIGLAPDMLPRVFEPFMQVGRGASAREGLGIGLTLVQRIAALHGGSVEARSRGLGEGSEFVVRLPLGKPGHVAAPVATPDVAAPGKQPPAGSTAVRRVLVVDDNADSRDSVAELVRSWGHDVAAAGDGASALSSAAAFKPEVVLLDIGLPDVDGYDVARRLRALPGLGRVFLVAMTGYGNERDRVASRNAGIDHHMVKPIDLRALERMLGRLPPVNATDSDLK